MEKENTLKEWEINICPLRNKQCLRKQCAWWLENENMCIVRKTGIGPFKRVE